MLGDWTPVLLIMGCVVRERERIHEVEICLLCCLPSSSYSITVSEVCLKFLKFAMNFAISLCSFQPVVNLETKL